MHFALEAHSVIEKGRRLVNKKFFELWNEELRSLLFKGTNFCVFCDLEKFSKFKDRKIYTACASGAALYSMRTLRALVREWYAQRV